jgi:hypothetical protein
VPPVYIRLKAVGSLPTLAGTAWASLPYSSSFTKPPAAVRACSASQRELG